MKVIRHDGGTAELAHESRFTGRVWRVDYIVPADEHAIAGLRLMYEPGARSYWHVHDREQAIIAVHGLGLVAWEGLAQPVELRVGDWWRVQPGTAHWHGAAPDMTFAHLAVTAGGGTTWLHEVSDDEYLTRGAAGGGHPGGDGSRLG